MQTRQTCRARTEIWGLAWQLQDACSGPGSIALNHCNCPWSPLKTSLFIPRNYRHICGTRTRAFVPSDIIVQSAWAACCCRRLSVEWTRGGCSQWKCTGRTILKRHYSFSEETLNSHFYSFLVTICFDFHNNLIIFIWTYVKTKTDKILLSQCQHRKQEHKN